MGCSEYRPTGEGAQLRALALLLDGQEHLGFFAKMRAAASEAASNLSSHCVVKTIYKGDQEQAHAFFKEAIREQPVVVRKERKQEKEKEEQKEEEKEEEKEKQKEEQKEKEKEKEN